MPEGQIGQQERFRPVVLVGGASARFGRDKLLEPIGDGGALLVDQPIGALREATDAPVSLVGACAPGVASRADGVIDDPYPGTGPTGGVLAALEAGPHDIIVLAGDLPGIDAATVRRLIDAANKYPDAWALIATTDRPHPTIGIYRQACVPALRAALESGRRSLERAIPEDRRALVEVSPGACVNVNRPDDLPQR